MIQTELDKAVGTGDECPKNFKTAHSKSFNDFTLFKYPPTAGVFFTFFLVVILYLTVSNFPPNTLVTHFRPIQQNHISMYRILVNHCSIVKTNTNRSLHIRNKIEALLVNGLPDLFIVTFSHSDAKSAPFKIKTTAKMCFVIKMLVQSMMQMLISSLQFCCVNCEALVQIPVVHD